MKRIATLAVAVLAAAAGLGMAGATPASASAPTVAGPILGGAWTGCGNANQGLWQSTIGAPLPMVTDGGGVTTVQQAATTLSWVAGCWQQNLLAAHPGTPVVYGMPVPSDTAPLSSADRAAYVSVATRLVSLGQQNAILRLGYEFNGTWMPWAAAPNPAQFVSNWQAIVTAIRAVPGANFRFDWNVSNGYMAFDARKAWPGSGYVDLVSDDLYDEDWSNCPQWGPGPGYPLPANDSAADIAARQQYVTHNLIYGNGQPYVAGQAAAPTSGEGWREFAVSQGVAFGLDEWGLDRDTGTDPGASCAGSNSDNGGNDDPYFIDAMMNWFHSTYQGKGIEYANYFNACDVGACNAGVDARINAGTAPASLARYLADLGTTTPAPVVPPAPVTTVPVVAPVPAPATDPVTLARADGTVLTYSGGPAGSWKQVDSNPATRMVTGSSPVFSLHKDGSIWQAATSGWKVVDVDGADVGIAVGPASFFKLHADGSVWSYTGSSFVEVDDNPSTTAIAADDTSLYELHRDGQLWRFNGSWSRIDANPSIAQVVASGSAVYERLSNGAVRRFDAAAGTWSVVDANPATTFIAAAGSSLYQLHSDGTAWLLGSTGTWLGLPTMPPAVSVAADVAAPAAVTTAAAPTVHVETPAVAQALAATLTAKVTTTRLTAAKKVAAKKKVAKKRS